MINITAFTWYFAALVSAFSARQMSRGRQKVKNVFLSHFTVAISLMTVSFLLFGSTWITPSPLILKTILFFGHMFLWISFVPLGEIAWYLRLKKIMPKWLPVLVIFIAGSFELYLEWSCKQSPYAVRINDFLSVMQVNLCVNDFVALFVIASVFLIPIGVIFLQEALTMERKLKIKSIGYGLTFLMASVAGSLITLKQPPIFLVIEDLFIISGFFILLVVNFFIGRLSSEEDKTKENFRT